MIVKWSKHKLCGVRVKSTGPGEPRGSCKDIFLLVSGKKNLLEEMWLPNLGSGDSGMSVPKERSSE